MNQPVGNRYGDSEIPLGPNSRSDGSKVESSAVTFSLLASAAIFSLLASAVIFSLLASAISVTSFSVPADLERTPHFRSTQRFSDPRCGLFLLF